MKFLERCVGARIEIKGMRDLFKDGIKYGYKDVNTGCAFCPYCEKLVKVNMDNTLRVHGRFV